MARKKHPETQQAPPRSNTPLSDDERQKIGEAIENSARDGNVEWLVEHYLDTCRPAEAREWLNEN